MNTKYTYRSDCGQARTTYHPEWSKALPWVTYANGDAGAHFPTARAAISHLEKKGFRFTKDTPQ